MITIDLGGRVVVVTGGTRGVGRGIATRFADAGAHVVVAARRDAADLPDGWESVTADIRDPDAGTSLIDGVVERHGRIDVLVNNAGGAPAADTASAPFRFTQRVIELNLLSAMHLAQRANHHMQLGDGGAIININSVASMRPAATAAAYGAAKSALASFTTTVGQEWAPKVRVNGVISGMVRTEQVHEYYGDDDAIARVEATVPIGRLAQPTEVGDVCVFLASPMASYVTGSNVVMHGGGDRPTFLLT